MRKSVLVAASAALVGVAVATQAAPAANDAERAACAALADERADVVLTGKGRFDLAWMADRENFARGSRTAPYLVRIAAGDGPRSLTEHDRLILPGQVLDWIAAPRAADLVLCSRRVPAAVVISRHLCTAGVSTGDIVNGEVEEISFLGGATWLADDLLAQTDGALPDEMAEDLRYDLAMASPDGHVRDALKPQVVTYAPKVTHMVAHWTMTAMSQALDIHGGAPPACLVRHADLRRGIVPARRTFSR